METSLVMAAVAGTGVVIPRVRSHSAQQQQRSVVSSSSSVFLGRRRGCGISRVGLVTEVGGGYRRRSSFGKLRVSRPVAEAPPPSVGKVDHLSPTQLLPGDEDGVSDIQRLATKGADRKKSLNDVDEKDLKDKTVFVRCDLNVPLDENCRITDDTRIRASLPTIQFLVKIGARVVLASHLGRPKKGPEAKFSLKPVAERLTELLGQKVELAPDCIGPDVEAKIGALKGGEVLLLENVRFHKEEEKNDIEFSKQLAKGIDCFVNDAFGTAHRAHASTAGIADYVSIRVAGFLLEKELAYLSSVIQRPKKPFVAIVGGSKISSKITVIESLMSVCDKVILGGGMVFTFFKAQGYSVGSSLVEDDKLDLATRLAEIAKEKGVDLILPKDVVCADKFAPDANTQICSSTSIPDGWMGLDIGPEAIKQYEDALKGSKTVLWNGPMGVFEFDSFAKGTYAIANAMAGLTKEGCVTIIGGGDSVAAVEKAGLAEAMSHVSTGGGASLELLEGKVLPGVAVLDDVRIHA
jgi:phosphoglycerate kinase